MVRDLHGWLSWLFIGANAAVGLWALVAHQYPRLRRRAGWVAVGIAEALVVTQVLLGVVLHSGEELDRDRHQLYGFAAFISIGLLFAYRNEMRDRPYLLYGLGSLWLMGLGVRAAFLQ